MGSSKSKHQVRHRPGQKRSGKLGLLRQRLRDRLGGDRLTFSESVDEIKMSEVLEEFVRPYLELAETEESFRKLIAVALVAWNASLLPKERQAEMIDEVLGELPPEVREDGKYIVKDLMRRKRRYFSEFRRVIVDFEVMDMGDGFRLVVASTPENV